MKTSINEEKCDNLVEKINDAVRYDEEYVGGDMTGEMNFYMWEGVRDLSDLDNTGPELEELIRVAKEQGVSEKGILDALKKHSEVELHGIRIPSDEYIKSWQVGEREVQVDGLGEDLKSLNAEELDNVKRRVDCTLGLRLDDFIYHDMSYSVYYLIPNIDDIFNELDLNEDNEI